MEKTQTVRNRRNTHANPPKTGESNPWRERARRRRLSWGGQYRASQTDRLSDDMERVIEFERQRAELAGSSVIQPF